MDRSIKTVRQLEQVFEPYRVVFRGRKEENKESHRNVSAKKENPKILKHVLLGGRERVSIIRGFSI
jgi:hypothetical protein